MMIPRLLHFCWIGPPMPDWAQDNVRLFCELNPEFLCFVHNEESLLPCLEPVYESIVGEHLWSRRCDVLRVSVLVRFGGWYFDTDFLPIRPLAEVYRDQGNFPRGCYVVQGDTVTDVHDSTGPKTRPWIANGVIGAAPDSPFLASVLRRILLDQDQTTWDAFGPKLFTELTERFPGLVHVGRTDDWFCLKSAQERRAAYKRIRAAGYTPQAIWRELGDYLPYAFHHDMQDRLEL